MSFSSCSSEFALTKRHLLRLEVTRVSAFGGKADIFYGGSKNSLWTLATRGTLTSSACAGAQTRGNIRTGAPR
jgi:hypothetical protein